MLTTVSSSRTKARARLVARRLLLITAHCSLLAAHFPATARRATPAAHAAAEGGWRRQPSGTFAWLHAVHFLDASRGWAVGGKGAMLRTEDGGATWRAVKSPTPDTMHDLTFADETTGWIACERDFYRRKSDAEARSYL
jgi:photosystem II stability/assembly factor-like uncharacterized protein